MKRVLTGIQKGSMHSAPRVRSPFRMERTRLVATGMLLLSIMAGPYSSASAVTTHIPFPAILLYAIEAQSQPTGQPTGQPLFQQPSLQDQFREDLFGEEGLRDPVSILPLPPRWPWILAAAIPLALVLLSIIHRILRKRRKPAIVLRTPPDQVAIEALQKLKPLVDKAEGRAFSYQASEIIRTYIEGRFAMQARNCTTREFLDAMVKQKDPLLAGQTTMLSRFLSYCDLAKYANQTMTPAELKEMYASAEGFIVATRAPIMAESASENPNTAN